MKLSHNTVSSQNNTHLKSKIGCIHMQVSIMHSLAVWQFRTQLSLALYGLQTGMLYAVYTLHAEFGLNIVTLVCYMQYTHYMQSLV